MDDPQSEGRIATHPRMSYCHPTASSATVEADVEVLVTCQLGEVSETISESIVGRVTERTIRRTDRLENGYLIQWYTSPSPKLDGVHFTLDDPDSSGQIERDRPRA